MERTYVAGDLHGSLDIFKLSRKYWPEQRHLTSDDALIQLGDFGLLWEAPDSLSKEAQFHLDVLGNKEYTVAFVDGNHENFDVLNSLPIVELWGGRAHRVQTNTGPVYHLIRGEIYIRNGKKFLALGGADSQDKLYRTEYVDWWKAERWSFEEQEYIYSQILNTPDIDYVVAHTCPNHIGQKLCEKLNADSEYYFGKRDCAVANMMDHLFDVPHFQPEAWHFGHWHQSLKLLDQHTLYQCHYNNSPVQID